VRETVTQPTIDAHRGRLVKTTGDGFLVEFASAAAALQCALDIQRKITAQESERSTEIAFGCESASTSAISS
jgi:adenylate cyclase